ncbi:MAG: hypothetical protein DPW18_04825, partial [Chloroflexi bacterium]|nr:hypothetical protein [Chloroflexota bacterium]
FMEASRSSFVSQLNFTRKASSFQSPQLNSQSQGLIEEVSAERIEYIPRWGSKQKALHMED